MTDTLSRALTAMTVLRPPQRVNTLSQVDERKAAGERLRAFVKQHKGRRSMDRLGLDAGLRGRQTLNEWFAGGDLYLSSLGQLADALGVRRVDLVAAYDGVIAPEQQEAPRPAWAEGLASMDDIAVLAQKVQDALTDEVRENREALVAAIAHDAARRVAEDLRELLPQMSDGAALGSEDR